MFVYIFFFLIFRLMNGLFVLALVYKNLEQSLDRKPSLASILKIKWRYNHWYLNNTLDWESFVENMKREVTYYKETNDSLFKVLLVEFIAWGSVSIEIIAHWEASKVSKGVGMWIVLS